MVKGLAGVLDVVTFARRRSEAVTAVVAPAPKQPETPVVGWCAHVSFKRAQASVVLDVDGSTIRSTTCPVRVYLYSLIR